MSDPNSSPYSHSPFTTSQLNGFAHSVMYLGVVLDDNLSFTLHAKHICTKANKRLRILKHMAGSPYGATQQTLLHYYTACIRPILEHGSMVMSIAFQSAVRHMSIQNTSLRIALRLPHHTHTKFVLAEAGCPEMDDRVKTLAMATCAKIKSSSVSHPFHQTNKGMHTSLHLLGNTPPGQETCLWKCPSFKQQPLLTSLKSGEYTPTPGTPLFRLWPLYSRCQSTL
jgi:hypothetical protein